MTRIETARLAMRSWRDDDLDAFHRINSDPSVMATLGPVMSRAQVATLIVRMQDLEAADGHCFWALETSEDARLIGWCGVIRGTTGPVAGKAELGWRLARDARGQGYASEAARATVDWVRTNLADDAVWAITADVNLRSRAVMQRLGMVHRPDLSFDHPRVPDGSSLKPHVTYSLEL